jgi:hypothetical protein
MCERLSYDWGSGGRKAYWIDGLGVIRPQIKTAPLDLGLSASIDFDSASSLSLPGQTADEPTIGL